MTETASYVIEITTHDEDDIIVGRQYCMLFLDDATADQLLASSVTRSL